MSDGDGTPISLKDGLRSMKVEGFKCSASASATFPSGAGSRIESAWEVRFGGYDDVDTFADGIWVLDFVARADFDRRGDDSISLRVALCDGVEEVI